MSEKGTVAVMLRHLVRQLDSDDNVIDKTIVAFDLINIADIADREQLASAERLEHCYLPMPRYEDGEPVEVGSVCEWGVVAAVEVTASDGGWGNWLVRCGEDAEPHEGTLNQLVERSVLVEGNPVRRGDKLWFGDERVTVCMVRDGTHILTDRTVIDENGYEVLYPFEPDELSWERPDTIERISEDAKKRVAVYWGCEGAICADCPAKVGGKRPADRYGVGECMSAMKLDLVRRTKKVCGK